MRWKACRVEFGRENECTGHSYSLKPQPAHFDSVATLLCCFTLLTSLCRPPRLSQCPQRAPLLSTLDEPSLWSDQGSTQRTLQHLLSFLSLHTPPPLPPSTASLVRLTWPQAGDSSTLPNTLSCFKVLPQSTSPQSLRAATLQWIDYGAVWGGGN